MVITRHFVFLHVPKTGGTFVRDVCLKQAPRGWEAHNWRPGRPHARYVSIPEDCAHLPVLCFVRNPWDWYVSWYEFLVGSHRGKDVTEVPRFWAWAAFDGGSADFKTAVTRACTGKDFPSPPTEELMRSTGCDHYSALHLRIAGPGIEAGRVDVGKFERLRDDFLAFLDRHQVPVTRTLREAIHGQPRANVSGRAYYRGYYDDDDELRDLVADKARKLIADYGYSF
jgi:hypothetical protein